MIEWIKQATPDEVAANLILKMSEVDTRTVANMIWALHDRAKTEGGDWIILWNRFVSTGIAESIHTPKAYLGQELLNERFRKETGRV